LKEVYLLHSGTLIYSKKCNEIISLVNTYFVGPWLLISKVLAAALVNGHVLFEDHPGLGKTLLAKVFAKSIGAKYRRVQFTPDLLPSDILGTKVWRGIEGRFELVKGPIFTNILLADEINRAPAKTQAALLEVMEERQVTIEGETFKMEEPFFVLATQNPIEYEGTYPLPEAQLDRFILKLSTGYPRSINEEVEILKRRLSWRVDDPTAYIKPIISAQEFVDIQRYVENKIYIDDALLQYIASLVRKVRESDHVEAGPSPRGGLALLKLSKAMALINGRNFVIPDDVKIFAVEALAHRIVLKPESVFEGVTPESIVKQAVDLVEVPKEWGKKAM